MKYEVYVGQIGWINYLRLVAAFGVVVVHVSAPAARNYADTTNMMWWGANLFDSLARWCVPAFVMVSGALIMGSDKTANLSAFYKKRLQRILIPFLFWTLFFAVIMTLKNKAGAKLILGTLKQALLGNPPSSHLWYLYMILGVYLCAPYLKKIAATWSEKTTRLFCIISFSLVSVYDAGNFFCFKQELLWLRFILYIPYFMFGYHVIRNKPWIRMSYLSLFSMLVASYVITSGGCYYFTLQSGFGNAQYLYSYFSPNVILMAGAIFILFAKLFQDTRSSARLTLIANASFGVYLIHPFFILCFKQAGIYESMGLTLWAIPLTSVCVYALSLIAICSMLKIPVAKKLV